MTKRIGQEANLIDPRFMIKALGVTIFCATLAACGSDDDPVVANDPQMQDPADPNAGDPNAGDPNAGDPNAGDPNAGDPNAGDPNAGDPNAGDPNAGDPNSGDPNAGDPSAIADGTELAAVIGGGTATVNQMSCKNENDLGTVTASTADIWFNRETLEFVVNGSAAFTGGFTWDSTSNEYVAARDEPVGTVLSESDAKVDIDGNPTYYYFKRSRILPSDEPYFYEIFECFNGLVVE